MQNPAPETDINFEKWLTTVNKISSNILSQENFDITTDAILALLKEHLNAFAACYLKVDAKEEYLELHSYTQSKFTNIVPIIPFDIYSLKYPIHHPKVLISSCVTQKKFIQAPSMKDFFYPVVKSKTLLNSIQKLIGIKLCIGIPVMIQEKVIGVYVMVTHSEKLTELQIKILHFYASISAITLDNTIKVKKLKQQYEAEKETAAMLTHELKTPIAIAHNSSELLSLTIKKYENILQDDFIARLREQQLEIHESILRMNLICNSIFSLTEVENGFSAESQRLDLSMSLSHLINTYQRLKNKDINLTYQEKIAPQTLYGGGIQFEQVISILLENAFKYTEKGSIDVDLEVSTKLMRCVITDTGPGIPKNKKAQIFERFFRIKDEEHTKKKGGLGLGLYIAKKITEKMKGSIIIEDNPKRKGCRFTVEFPVYLNLDNS
jgi:signal transduction histidine kinase